MNPLLTRLTHPKIYNWLVENEKKLPEDHAVMLIHPEAATEAIAKYRHELPRVEIYYAYKCFSDAEIVKAIDSLVDGYDVASENECRDLIKLGVKPSRLLYANPVKIPTQIAYAHTVGVQGYTFQSRNELEKMAKLAPGSSVLCRVKIPDGTNITGQAFSKKFGVEPSAVVNLMKYAQELGLKPEGISFHVGSQSSLPELWTTAIELCADLMKDCEEAGVPLTTLDIGGGWPAAYETGGYHEFETIAKAVREALSKYVPKDIRVISEPGRFIVVNTASIVTTIIGRETRGSQEWLFLDTGVFQCMVEVLEFHRLLQKPVPMKLNDSPNTPYTLAGPTCDSDDTIEQGVQLPDNLQIGDKIVLTLAGAYTLAYGSDFNGINRPTKIYL